jgi:hypothetical protein
VLIDGTHWEQLLSTFIVVIPSPMRPFMTFGSRLHVWDLIASVIWSQHQQEKLLIQEKEGNQELKRLLKLEKEKSEKLDQELV